MHQREDRFLPRQFRKEDFVAKNYLGKKTEDGQAQSNCIYYQHTTKIHISIISMQVEPGHVC
jgi:hypothetical protein